MEIRGWLRSSLRRGERATVLKTTDKSPWMVTVQPTKGERGAESTEVAQRIGSYSLVRGGREGACGSRGACGPRGRTRTSSARREGVSSCERSGCIFARHRHMNAEGQP